MKFPITVYRNISYAFGYLGTRNFRKKNSPAVPDDRIYVRDTTGDRNPPNWRDQTGKDHASGGRRESIQRHTVMIMHRTKITLKYCIQHHFFSFSLFSFLPGTDCRSFLFQGATRYRQQPHRIRHRIHMYVHRQTG